MSVNNIVVRIKS